jgi:EAL domain-containing protein (putative c-di-GMP-specific phosphodiesterase class I)
LKVIGEWIETEEDLEILTNCGVDYLQGNLFGAASLELPWTKSGESAFDSFAEIEPQEEEVQPEESVETIAPIEEEPAIEESLDDRLARLRDMLKSLDDDLSASTGPQAASA